MAKIDEIKEEIGWLKFWIGVMAASFMGMVSYINSNYDQMSTFSLALFSINNFIISNRSF